MSKNRKNQRKSLKLWQTAARTEADSHNEPFAQIGISVLGHPQFKKLPYSARSLYIEMCASCKGAIEFIFPFSASVQGLNAKTFYDSIDKLQAEGFIERIYHGRNLQKPNRYRFSFKWKEYG